MSKGINTLLAFIESRKSVSELTNSSNQKLTSNLIPKGYPKREGSKVYDSEFNEPINLPNYQIEKLINN